MQLPVATSRVGTGSLYFVFGKIKTFSSRKNFLYCSKTIVFTGLFNLRQSVIRSLIHKAQLDPIETARSAADAHLVD
jgi:hypothetical protein